MNKMSQLIYQSYDQLIRFPALSDDHGSLTAMEKSLLAHFILLARPRTIVELGVFRALTTQFMCEFLIENGIDGRVIGFDLPEVVAELRQKNEAMHRFEAMQRLQLIPGRLPQSLRTWLNNMSDPFDIALVDATHNYGSVTAELNLLWPRLSRSGFILCHDYSSRYDGVRCVVDRFVAKHEAVSLPLSSSAAAREAGHASVLVAVAHRSDRLTTRRLLPHWWLSAKHGLLAHPWFNQMWRRVRPLVRRGR
jgi:predicted O-methyltransferase YrrM